MVTVAVMGAVLVAMLAFSGVTAIGALAAPRAASASEALPKPPTGAQTPVADPSTPPDRVSDQTEAVKHPDTVYRISEGDTLTSISAKLGVSVDAIADYNAVRDINVISEGAVIRLPFIYVPPAPAQ